MVAVARSTVLLVALCLAGAAFAGCATGDDGVNPRGGDGGGIDAGTRSDAATPPVCDPVCASGETCQAGVCVSGATDADGDGVSAAQDCDDSDASVGASAERPCTSSCGAGVERCTSGVWATCSAPTTCECTTGAAPRDLDCERCGTQRQTCVEGMWMNDGACTGMGACSPGETQAGAACGMCGHEERTCGTGCTFGAPVCVGESGECVGGAVDSETRACPGGCGGTQTRSRTCSASACTWGVFSAWTGSCPTCGPVCGDGTCDTGETCSACVDCRYGHMGTGSGGSSCAGVPEGQWRCVTQSGLGVVSQVCRSGAWVNFNLSPMDCAACVCTFSTACCQPGSPSTGC